MVVIIYPTECKRNLRIILQVESFIRRLIKSDNIRNKRANKGTLFH